MAEYRTPGQYYASTAAQYDALHVHKDDEHYIALRYASALIGTLGARSVLDVGAGTGRGVEYFLDHHPNVRAVGVEPVEQLRSVARPKLPGACMLAASGLQLPFKDQSFDVVCEFGVLHHVDTPAVFVREMTRVARRAVILSDENRFAYGNWPVRWLKVLLCKTGMFSLFYRVVTGGKGHRYSEQDGIAYSYSVFDSVRDLGLWGDRLITIGLDRSSASPQWSPSGTLFSPLLESFHVMLASVRDLQ
jgi:ubiquinone/menaquinone biosynthesis C-methylase UbiE